MKFLLLLSLLLANTLAQKSFADNIERYTFDKDHTNIIMAVNHLGFSDLYLKTTTYDGHIMFNENDLTQSSVEITFEAMGIDGDHEGLNQHLQSADFFNVSKFEKIKFKSTSIKAVDDKNLDIIGEITILGITKPLTLNAVFNKAGENPFTKSYTIGFSAKTALKRSEFGMDYGLPLIGDDVNFIIEVEANKEK